MGFMDSFFGPGASAPQVNQAVSNLAGIGTTATGTMGQQQKLADVAGQGATNFYTNQMLNGLPQYRAMTDYSGGTIGRAFAPQYGGIYRQTSTMGTNTPSGYRDALINNLRAQQGGAFDQSLNQAMMANQMAKQQGAAGVMGEQQIAQGSALGYGNLGAGANQAIFGAPQRGSIAGTLGGMVTGLGNTAANMKNAGFFGG